MVIRQWVWLEFDLRFQNQLQQLQQLLTQSCQAAKRNYFERIGTSCRNKNLLPLMDCQLSPFR